MAAIRPEPRDTSFETPARADIGGMEYYKELVYDTLYHSPVGTYGTLGGPKGGVERFSELYLANRDESDVLLTPQQATKDYGMDGELRFDEPIREQAAMIMQDRKIAELRREYLLQSGLDDHWGRKVTGFGVSMVGSLVDPVNLASMFVPVVGESRALSGLARAKGFLGRGLISPKTLAKTIGGGATGFRLAKGALEGLVGTSLIEPFNVIPSIQEQGHYEWTDSAAGIAMGAGLGAGLHGVLGLVHDKFRKLRAGLKELDPQTHEAAVMSAVSDLMKDEHVASPSKIVDVDHVNVEDTIKQKYIDAQVEEHYPRYVAERSSRLDTLQKTLDTLKQKIDVPFPKTEDFVELGKVQDEVNLIKEELGQNKLDASHVMSEKDSNALYDKGLQLTRELNKLQAKVKSDPFPQTTDFGRINKIKDEVKKIQTTLLVEAQKIKDLNSEQHKVGDVAPEKIKNTLRKELETKLNDLMDNSLESEKKIHLQGMMTPEAKEIIDAQVREETMRRVQETAKKESLAAPEKVVDQTPPSDKSLGTETIQETPEPLIELTEKEMDEAQAELEKETADLERELLKSTEPDKESKSAVDQLASEIKKWSDKVINESKGRINMGLDPELMAAYAVRGVSLFYKGVKDFGAWSEAMLKEFGEGVKPYLKELHQTFLNFFNGNFPKGSVEEAIYKNVQSAKNPNSGPEKITATAMKVNGKGKGKIYTGRMHFEIQDLPNFPKYMGVVNDMVDGFVTDKGRFVTREEAAKLAGIKIVDTEEGLHSSELQAIQDRQNRDIVFTPEMETSLQTQLTAEFHDENIKDMAKISKAVEAGVGCILNKAI